jgi:hypothetical protein
MGVILGLRTTLHTTQIDASGETEGVCEAVEEEIARVSVKGSG